MRKFTHELQLENDRGAVETLFIFFKLGMTNASDRCLERFMLHVIRPRLVHNWFRKTTIAFSLALSESDSP